MILQALEERISRDIENEILNFKRHPIGNDCELIQRKAHTFRTGDRLNIGSMEIEPIHVDHSIPGAYGFIIYTSEGTIVYSGDVRLHGSKPQMTQEFVEKIRKIRPITLIMEGTRITDERFQRVNKR